MSCVSYHMHTAEWYMLFHDATVAFRKSICSSIAEPQRLNSSTLSRFKIVKHGSQHVVTMQTLDIGMERDGRSPENEVVEAGALLTATTSCTRLLHLAFSIAISLDMSRLELFGRPLAACSLFCEYLVSVRCSHLRAPAHKTNGFPSHRQLVSHRHLTFRLVAKVLPVSWSRLALS